jgi:hypothetical protein
MRIRVSSDHIQVVTLHDVTKLSLSKADPRDRDYRRKRKCCHPNTVPALLCPGTHYGIQKPPKENQGRLCLLATVKPEICARSTLAAVLSFSQDVLFEDVSNVFAIGWTLPVTAQLSFLAELDCTLSPLVSVRRKNPVICEDAVSC